MVLKLLIKLLDYIKWSQKHRNKVSKLWNPLIIFIDLLELKKNRIVSFALLFILLLSLREQHWCARYAVLIKKCLFIYVEVVLTNIMLMRKCLFLRKMRRKQRVQKKLKEWPWWKYWERSRVREKRMIILILRVWSINWIWWLRNILIKFKNWLIKMRKETWSLVNITWQCY